MSGVAGGARIEKANVHSTFDKYIKDVLEKVPGFVKASLSGSVKVGTKPDYGDLDLITHFEGEDKKEVKKRIIQIVNELPSSIIVPFLNDRYKGRKYYNSGEIITVLYPIVGKQDEYIQVDNIIALSDEEHTFKNSFLDIPAEKQGLILGLAKVIMLEEDPTEVLKKAGVTDVPELAEDEELEFNLSSNKLTLRKVKLADFKTIARETIWSSTDWNKIKTIFSNYNLDGSFEELLKDLQTNLKNPRSKNRIKGIFKSMVSVKSGEVGTPKGDNKNKALHQVDTLLEGETEQTVALYAGGFKPPHSAHFLNAKLLADKADKLIVFIGPKKRNGIEITPQQSAKIWKIYSRYIGIPVEVVKSSISPIRDIYDYAEEQKGQGIKILTGAMDSEMSRFSTFRKNTEKYGQVELLPLPKIDFEEAKLSATDIRSSKEHINSGNWTPEELSNHDRKLAIYVASENIEEEAIEETISGGNAVRPTIVQNSEDKFEIVNLHKQLRKQLDPETFQVEFKQDHISIRSKNVSKEAGFDYSPYITSILEHMVEQKMNILPLPKLKIKKDLNESANFFGKTAYYMPGEEPEVVLYVQGRHPKDVMRSFTHEMIHHIQHLEDRIQNITTTDTNSSEHLQDIEKEAYLRGNMTFRNWSDGIDKEEHEMNETLIKREN